MIVLARLIYYAFNLYELGLLVYIVCSWIGHSSAVSLRLWLGRWYEPLLTPIRRIVPLLRLGAAAVDLSPFILLIFLAILKDILLSLLVPPF